TPALAPTPTATASFSPSAAPTATPSITPSATPTATATPTVSSTATPTPTASPTGTPSCTPPVVIFQGSLTNTDPTKNAVIGSLSSCALSPPCAGGVEGAYHYDAYQLTNPSGDPACITVTLSDPECIYSDIYLNSFDPNNA